MRTMKVNKEILRKIDCAQPHEIRKKDERDMGGRFLCECGTQDFIRIDKRKGLIFFITRDEFEKIAKEGRAAKDGYSCFYKPRSEDFAADILREQGLDVFVDFFDF